MQPCEHGGMCTKYADELLLCLDQAGDTAQTYQQQFFFCIARSTLKPSGLSKAFNAAVKPEIKCVEGKKGEGHSKTRYGDKRQ